MKTKQSHFFQYKYGENESKCIIIEVKINYSTGFYKIVTTSKIKRSKNVTPEQLKEEEDAIIKANAKGLQKALQILNK